MLALGGSHQHKAHERRLFEVEATNAFAVHQRLELPVAFRFA
jgi:hypothetical protein